MPPIYQQIGNKKVFRPTHYSRAAHVWIAIILVFVLCVFGPIAANLRKIDASSSPLIWCLAGVYVLMVLSLSILVELGRGYRVEWDGSNLTQIRALFGKTVRRRIISLDKGYRFSTVTHRGDTVTINVVVDKTRIPIAVVPSPDVAACESILIAVLGRDRALDPNPVVPAPSTEMTPRQKRYYWGAMIVFFCSFIFCTILFGTHDIFPTAEVITDDSGYTEVKCDNIRLYYSNASWEGRRRQPGLASFLRLAGYPYAHVHGDGDCSLSMLWNVGCATEYMVTYDPYEVSDIYSPKLHIPAGNQVGAVLSDGSAIVVTLRSDAKYRRQEQGGRGSHPTQEFRVYAHYTPEQYRQMITLGVDSFWVDTEEGRLSCPIDRLSRRELRRKQTLVLEKATQLSSLPRLQTKTIHPKRRSDL